RLSRSCRGLLRSPASLPFTRTLAAFPLAVSLPQHRVRMSMDAFADWPVAAIGSPRILEVGQQSQMFRVHTAPVFALVVDRHPLGDLRAMRIDPRGAVREHHAVSRDRLVVPPDLRISV